MSTNQRNRSHPDRIEIVATGWIELEGLANLRDVGGLATADGGTIARGRLLRSDNLQSLTRHDVDRLLEIGLTDVVDLRSAYEVASEGPGPMTRTEQVTIHHYSLFREDSEEVSDAPAAEQEMPGEALPWVGLRPSVTVGNSFASQYLSYLRDRPESVVAALRAVAYAEGAALVHCAAGKDRTGTVVALSLLSVGAEPGAVVADYAASGERIERIVDRLLATRTYAANLRGRPLESHLTRPETMQSFVDHVNSEYGGVDGLLDHLGWTSEDADRMRHKLRD